MEKLCKQYDALLIFDQMVTGVRRGMSGAQGYFDVLPDLTIFGKAIGGGYPGAGGIGGKEEAMKYLSSCIGGTPIIPKLWWGDPGGCGYQLGGRVLCPPPHRGNEAIQKSGTFADELMEGINGLIHKYHLPFVAFNHGSICHLETTGAMHFVLDRSKPWQIPQVLKETSARKTEMEHMGGAYPAEGLVTSVEVACRPMGPMKKICSRMCCPGSMEYRAM